MRRAGCWLLWMSLVGWAWGQQVSSSSGTVPTVIRFSGNLADANGKSASGMVGVTFSLYKDEQGGAALWVETQNVKADKSGHYAVTLGSTTSQGLPTDLFATGEARWLGVQPQGQAEQSRVLLMSVPYALKAADAETVGGLPASAFVLATPSSRASTAVTAVSPPTGGSGTMNYIPIWTDGSGDLGNSVLYQTSSGRVGISTTTPATTLDVGTGDVLIDSGNLDLPQTGGGTVGVLTIGGAPFIQACCSLSAGNTSVGNSALGFNLGATHNTAVGYQALANTNAPDNTASGYQALVSNGQGKSNTAVGSAALLQNTTGNLNTALGNRAGYTNTTVGSNNTLVGAGADVGADGLTFATAIGSNAVVNESNALVLGGTGANAVQVGIGTATPAATLDVQGTGNFTGLITFAPNQTFPGAGSGTVTSVGSGPGLTGGPITSSGTLSIATAGVTNAMLANPGLTVSAGTDLTGGGPVALGGSTTLNLDTTRVPQLQTANSFTADQAVKGNLSATKSVTSHMVSAAVFNLGSNPFAFGNYKIGSAFLGFSGNSTVTGHGNTGVGYKALESDGKGALNTAVGAAALILNDHGSQNVAIGYEALKSNVQGTLNTALGYGADVGSGYINGATAIGAGAVVKEDNALVLGSFGIRVGIGTSTPSNIFTIGQGQGHAIADAWDTYSSRRWKTNIQTLRGSLEKVEQLRGVSYDLKDSGKHEVGVIAEEVGAVVPEVVSWETNGKDAHGVDYSRLTALLIEATKEQQALIQKQQGQIKVQQRQIKAQQIQIQAERTRSEARFAQLTSQVNAIQASLKTISAMGAEVHTATVHAPARLSDEAGRLRRPAAINPRIASGAPGRNN
jgi:hypothetical protein